MLKGIFKIHKLSCGGNLCTVNTDFKPNWKLWYLEGFKMFHVSETEPSVSLCTESPNNIEGNTEIKTGTGSCVVARHKGTDKGE